MYAIYLRKSRADLEAEARGEGETLARHRQTLTSMAASRDLAIGRIYEEIVSGDTIAARPQMQALLRDVEKRMWQGILVMDVDRLGRGDSIDQGVILKTLKYADTIIITPYKTFDPNSEMDEEFFEYGQFMARGEYKRIKRRMWAGRVASAREGKYQSPKPPFGYRRVRLEGQKGWSLEPVPEQADGVRMVFRWYGAEGIGMGSIAQRLNLMGHRTYSGKPFARSEIRGILSNPVYIGKIRWNQRRSAKSMRDGVEVTSRPRSAECFVADGLHPALVDDAAWEAVQRRLGSHQPHKPAGSPIQAALAGLIVCKYCGKAMPRKPAKNSPTTYVCRTPGCPTSGIGEEFVENAVLESLQGWLKLTERPMAEPPSAPDNNAAAQRQQLRHQLDTLARQQATLHDLLEQGIYDAYTFVSRSRTLAQRRAELEALLAEAAAPTPTKEAAIRALEPQLRRVLDAWPAATAPADKNRLLRSVIARVVYDKTHRCTRAEDPGAFLTVDVTPVLVEGLEGDSSVR